MRRGSAPSDGRRAGEPPAGAGPRTLVVGCGRVGGRLGRRLTESGGEVLGLRRSRTNDPSPFPVLGIDLGEPLREELPSAEGLVIALPPGGLAPPEAEDGYRAALEHLAAALPCTPQRAVFVSSTRVFEGRQGERPLTERDEPAPASPRARTLLRGERLAQELFGASIVRSAGIYGPGREMLIRKVTAGEPVAYARRTNRIHEADLAALLHAVLRAPDPPPLLHAVDRAPGVPLGEVVEHIAGLLRRPAPPRSATDAAGGSVYDGGRALALLGELAYPTYREGYAEIVGGPRPGEPRSDEGPAR